MRAARVLSIVLAIPFCALSQAWLSPKGDGVVTMLYQYDIERLHSFSDGRTKDRGHTYLDAVFVNTDLSLTDKIAFSVSMPFIAGKYVGPFHTCW